MTDAAEVAELLAERPDLKPALQAALETDREHDNWTFDDIDVDSGSFGELVGRNIVVQADDGYRLASPDAVERALSGNISDDTGGASRDDTQFGLSGIRAIIPTVDRVAVAGLASTLILIALLRITSLSAVFRDQVVLSGNDPYLYRYWVDQTLAQSGGGFNVSVLSSLPPGVPNGEPLLVATLSAVSALAGGGQTATGWVLAWYPVVSAVITGGLVYVLALRVSDDRRVALAAVAMLAVIPAHGLRTSLGFADHHAFDYPWLVLTAIGMVTLLGRDRTTFEYTSRDIGAVLAIAAGVAGQVLAWEAGPLLIAPIGVVVALIAVSAVYRQRTLLPVGLPVVGGLLLAALAAGTVHFALGWQTDQVAFAPAILLAGIGFLLATGEVFRRFDLPAAGLAGVELLGAIVAAGVIQFILPSYWARLANRVEFLLSAQPIAEVQSLFSGPIGILLLFGFVLVLAVPYMIWGAFQGARGDRRWLAIVVYSWYFLVLATLQVRFGGELSPFAAVFAGLGFVHLAERVDIAAPPLPMQGERPLRARADGGRLPRPTRQQIGATVVLFLLVGSLGLIQVPVKTSQLTIDEGQYETAAYLSEQAQREDITYPDNYVFSEWGRNRMYNYFVNGEARSYTFARENYAGFLSATTAEKAHERLQGRQGYVVTTSRSQFGPAMVQTRLHQQYGSASDQAPGLGRFQALYASDGGRYKAFQVVNGATLIGSASPESEFTASTDVDVPGASFEYTREVQANRYGAYDVTVANPGTYALNGAEVTVSEEQVHNGSVVSLFDAEGTVYWSFDEATTEQVYDRTGSNHLTVEGGKWVDGQSGGALAFDEPGEQATVRRPEGLTIGPDESVTIDFYVRGDLSNSTANFPRVFVAAGETGNVAVYGNKNADRLVARVTDDQEQKLLLFDGGSTTFAEWTRLTLIVDRGEDVVRLYRNGELSDSTQAPDLGRITIDSRVAFGDTPNKDGSTNIAVDEFRMYEGIREPGTERE